jgi:SAM-dependent methyltransferase
MAPNDDARASGTRMVVESRRKLAIRELADHFAAERDDWIERNRFYHEEDERYLRFLVGPGQRVLDLGCGSGHVLAALNPKCGVGVDFSSLMIDEARRRHPHLEFHVGDVEDPSVLEALDGPFDVILLADTIGSLEDCQRTLVNLHRLCHRETRVVIAYYSRLWSPLLYAAKVIGQQMPQTELNWLAAQDLADIMDLADFQVVRLDSRQIVPKHAGGVGSLANRFIGTLPAIRRLALRNYVVARPGREAALGPRSATVVIPCRNEAGNVAPAIDRLPRFTDDIEVIFVEGHSNDNTVMEIQRVIEKHPDLDIKLMHQDGKGKADAVREGFDAARGEVLMILDADLTTPPEDLPKFYEAITRGKGELIMGSRLVYPMERDAMRALNILGNKVFSVLFSWLLNQRITDTLCGTKVISRSHYEKIKQGRGYFGEFDPFGDFDLIFGAAKLNLEIVEVPVRYRARTYGSTQISRFRHGWLLLRMVVVAWRKLKAV